METIIWAVAAIVISVSFFFIFKVPLSQFLGRTVSIGKDGVETRRVEAHGVVELRSELEQAQREISLVKEELLRMQKNIGYTHGEL